MHFVYQNSFLKAARAVNALIETNYIDEFPLPIKEIIENDSNVELFTFKEFCNITGYSLNELQTYGGSDEAFHIKKGNKFAIIYNENVYNRRLRFTLAHEYGHYIMEHDGMSYKKTPIFQDAQRTHLEEYEANSFASCLLFPLNVRYKYRNVLNEYDVADLFEISYQAAKVALDIFDEHMEGLMAYQARLKSPTKLGTQHIVDKLLQSDKDISLELKDTGEKWEFYMNGIYISHVLDSKYKAVGYRMKDLDHIDIIKEETKSGYNKITPIIYSKFDS